MCGLVPPSVLPPSYPWRRFLFGGVGDAEDKTGSPVRTRESALHILDTFLTWLRKWSQKQSSSLSLCGSLSVDSFLDLAGCYNPSKCPTHQPASRLGREQRGNTGSPEMLLTQREGEPSSPLPALDHHQLYSANDSRKIQTSLEQGTKNTANSPVINSISSIYLGS